MYRERDPLTRVETSEKVIMMLVWMTVVFNGQMQIFVKAKNNTPLGLTLAIVVSSRLNRTLAGDSIDIENKG